LVKAPKGNVGQSVFSRIKQLAKVEDSANVELLHVEGSKAMDLVQVVGTFHPVKGDEEPGVPALAEFAFILAEACPMRFANITTPELTSRNTSNLLAIIRNRSAPRGFVLIRHVYPGLGIKLPKSLARQAARTS